MHQKILLLLLLLLLEHITLNKPFPDSTDVEASGFEVAGTQHSCQLVSMLVCELGLPTGFLDTCL